MAVVVKSQNKPSAYSDPATWAQVLEDNIDKSNDNARAAADAIDAINAVPAVKSVLQGGTTYTPDSTGKLTLPVNAPRAEAMTTTQRDALSGADLFTGRLIFNTTVQQLQVYNGSNWQTAGDAHSKAIRFIRIGGVLTQIIETRPDNSVRITTLRYANDRPTQVARLNPVSTDNFTYDAAGYLTNHAAV